ncbi:MAG: hypothetical protein HY680_02920 [Chloroflexi bacterium]|nr:hypothetical protein [Chloroflexota bacterium]
MYQTSLNAIFDVFLFPFGSGPPVIGLAAVSLGAGVLMVVIFRYASNQRGIRAAKEKIKAHLLEIRLFKDDPVLIMRAQKQVCMASLVYMRYALVPFTVLVVPLLILLLQLNLYFGYRPLRPGESAIVAVKVPEQVPWSDVTVQLDAPQGMAIETPALRMEEEREVDWRLKATQEGRFQLTVKLADREFQKEVRVGDRLARVTPSRRGAQLLAMGFAQGEPVLPSGAPVEAIEVRYPPRSIGVLGWQVHWFVVFLVLSLASGYTLSWVFRIEV